MDTDEIVKIAKALSDKNRVEIIKLLSEEELCACHILNQLQIAQSTLSHHMKQLTDSKLVTVTKKGRWSHYKINTKTVNDFKQFLDTYKNTSKINKCNINCD
ncbi:MAG: winged helix-turn-helix transcriptional regulator [Methanosphaera sp.]|nr:winged helix-turn-helix transcriptional regulator [Methanosphaera sp.]